MITSTKSILKKKKRRKKKRTDRTLGQMVKAKLYRQNHTQKHTHTLSQKEKKGGKIYIVAPKVHLLKLGWFVVYSVIPQMQGTSRWLWRFNPLLLRLLGEITLSLPFSHSSWDSALDLAPPLLVGLLRASVLRSHRMGLKEQLIRGLWLTQAGGREAFRMRGDPAVAEAVVTLHQPEARRVFSRRSCPWVTGPWQWQAAHAPGRGGVDSDLCLHTGFLVAAVAALASHAHLWGPRW